MTYKSSFSVAAVTMLLAAAFSRFRAVYDKCVPVGYEDEGGFHSGDEPDV